MKYCRHFWFSLSALNFLSQLELKITFSVAAESLLDISLNFKAYIYIRLIMIYTMFTPNIYSFVSNVAFMYTPSVLHVCMTELVMKKRTLFNNNNSRRVFFSSHFVYMNLEIQPVINIYSQKWWLNYLRRRVVPIY